MAKMSGYAKFAEGAGNLGGAMLQVPKALFNSLFGSAGTVGTAGGMAARATNGAVGTAAGLSGRVMNGVAAVIKFKPTWVGLGALAVGGLAIKNHYNNKREAALNNYAAAEQMRYMNSTNPQEYAMMQERMRGTAPGQGGMADKIQADRAAAAEAVKG